MELESLRLDFLFTIFFFRFFFFFFHLPSHSLLPSPQKPKIVLPSSSKSISQNPKPKSQSQSEQKSKPKNHNFSTEAPWVWWSRHRRNIFCCGFVFSILPSSSKSISWVHVFSIREKIAESWSQSKQKLLRVHGSCFLDHLNPFRGFVFSQSE